MDVSVREEDYFTRLTFSGLAAEARRFDFPLLPVSEFGTTEKRLSSSDMSNSAALTKI